MQGGPPPLCTITSPGAGMQLIVNTDQQRSASAALQGSCVDILSHREGRQGVSERLLFVIAGEWIANRVSQDKGAVRQLGRPGRGGGKGIQVQGGAARTLHQASGLMLPVIFLPEAQ